jgi:glycosyltransferase involved in cell wall biosynthesis
MSDLPTVAVLLAVYEPSDALIAQLKSINRQVGVNVILYIGDDGSSSDVKEKYKEYLPEFFYYFSSNRVGPGQNFMNLLSNTRNEDYFAFCDQDDIWLVDKLHNHISILALEDHIVAGTHSNSAVLRGGKVSLKKLRCNEHLLAQMLSENCVQGCTLVINRRARDLICSENNQHVVWHDWWIGLILSSIGKLILVSGTDTLYRLHQENAIGIPDFKVRVKRSFARKPGTIVNQHKLFFDSYSHHIRERDLEALQDWITAWDRGLLGRLLAAISDQKRRKSLTDDVFRRIIGVSKKP